MWQRKQTLFLVLALAATIVCLCMPIGTFPSAELDGAGEVVMTNLWIQVGPVKSFVVWALFAILLFTCPLCLMAIFLFRNRKMQMRLCTMAILLNLGWIIVYCIFGFMKGIVEANIVPTWAAALPAVAIILYYMARRGIRHDERLVRAADRIR